MTTIPLSAKVQRVLDMATSVEHLEQLYAPFAAQVSNDPEKNRILSAYRQRKTELERGTTWPAR